MPASQAARQYREAGFVGPLRAFEADEIEGSVREIARRVGVPDFTLSTRRNRHLDWPLVTDLTQAAVFSDLAGEILGPDLVLWRSQIFVASSGRGLGWHQDEYNSILADPEDNVSFHLALTASSIDNCVSVIAGSHRMSREELSGWGFNFNLRSDLNKGYGTPSFWRDPRSAPEVTRMVLAPGEFFAFHPRLLHASLDVTTPPEVRMVASPGAPDAAPRIGIALRVTSARNQVFPTAFAETHERGDHCVTFPSGDPL